MKLIANKPCSFSGMQFYIGDEIPAKFVADARLQEKLGVLTVVDDGGAGRPSGQPGVFYTQEQLDGMIQEAVDEALNNVAAEIQKSAAELQESGTGVYEGAVMIPVKGDSSGENGQMTAVPAMPEEIKQVFAVMQLNAADGAEAVASIKSENALILLHAADSRKTIKDAAKKQADNLFPAGRNLDAPTGGNEPTGPSTQETPLQPQGGGA